MKEEKTSRPRFISGGSRPSGRLPLVSAHAPDLPARAVLGGGFRSNAAGTRAAALEGGFPGSEARAGLASVQIRGLALSFAVGGWAPALMGSRTARQAGLRPGHRVRWTWALVSAPRLAFLLTLAQAQCALWRNPSRSDPSGVISSVLAFLSAAQGLQGAES